MKQTHLLRNSYRFLIDLVYPNRCPCCNQVIAWDAWICEACQIETALNPDTVCSGCGKPFDDCMCLESLAFDGAMTVSRYEGRARQGILQLKQAENLNFANYTGTVLGERILQKPDWMMADAIVPVPMQQHQWILRGKNPAERIANAISFVTKIPVRTDLLWKKPGGIPQHTLNAEQRRTNVLQFASAGKSLKGYIFILCDDVLTTGSTANYCASLLKQCGAERVYVATATTTTKIKV